MILSFQYLAGLFDGEGNISVGRVPKGTKPFQRFDWYSVKITITNTNQEVILLLHEQWGGSVNKMFKKDRHKQAWKWCCSAKKAQTFLIAVLPYLVIKKQAAKAALRLQENLKMGGRYRCITEQDQALRLVLFNAVRKANKRGDSDYKPREDETQKLEQISQVRKRWRKLTPENVKDIKNALSNGQNGAQLARLHGVTTSCISLINTGKSRAAG